MCSQSDPGAARGEPIDDLVEAVMTASRVLVAVAARSVAAVDEDVTLPQYRALIVLGQHGALRPLDLAATLAVTPSTGTRMCDRLVAKDLVARERPEDDRRSVHVALTPVGRALVDEVTRRRRDEVAALLAVVPAARRREVIDGLRLLADAAGEIPDPDWALS